jgi:phenylpyruvate tautomerase PptA (4-oxalocrotonate tautomerase family)
MPLVKIELTEGLDRGTLIKLRDLVMDAVVESLKLVPDDRNIRIVEYKPGLFQMKAPYEILIEITMFLGRSKAAKKKLYKLIVDSLFDNLKIEKNKVFIVINEQPLENWGIKGGIPADEVQLGFDVNI